MEAQSHKHKATLRFKDPIDLTLRDLLDEVRGVCPRCENCARNVMSADGSSRQLTCFFCGFNKSFERGGYSTSEPIDPFVGLPLWLVEQTPKGALYAYNSKHLDLLEQYISAHLRERKPGEHGWRNQGYFARLPRWIKAQENREMLKHKITMLRQRAGELTIGGPL